MTTELAQLELLAQIDDLIAQMSDWAEEPSGWETVRQGKSLIRRLLQRIEPLRARVEAPLVVATFGGTGVGKSSLVNALVGADVSQAGRQRPTTTNPILLAHPQTDLTTYELPLDELRVVRREIPLLRDIVLIDCPDPDTTEAETSESNLARLHRLLPYCDVLLYVSTQQKYRSARVSDELLQAASGCRLVFVQTHADLDEDIRDDWRAHLNSRYAVSELFFVDSRRALQEQQQGVRPTGEFGRLIDLLFRELSTTQRVRIRRANLLGLVQDAVRRTSDQFEQASTSVDALAAALRQQQARCVERMASRLSEELLVSRGLWEHRLLGQITQLWGYSPFASVLRLWYSQAALLASATFMRAKSTAQMALLGVVHGSRWLASRTQEQEAERRLESLATLGLTEVQLRESQLIVRGHLQAAGLAIGSSGEAPIDNLRTAAADVQNEFLTDAARRIDALILETARRNSHWWTRLRYEVTFALLPAFILYRAGKNFFFDSFWLNQPHLDSTFYIPAMLFLILWAGLHVMAFTTRLRRGLTRHVETLARELATGSLGASLFPEVEQQCQAFAMDRNRLVAFRNRIEAIRQQYGGPSDLGSVRT